MKKTYQISESEWMVLQCLFKKSPQGIGELADMLRDKTDWNTNMIRTLIVRLQEKGIVGAKKDSRFFRYYPLVDQQDCVMQETESFLNRVFDGSPAKMIAALTGGGRLSKEDCAEIEAMIARMKEGK